MAEVHVGSNTRNVKLPKREISLRSFLEISTLEVDIFFTGRLAQPVSAVRIPTFLGRNQVFELTPLDLIAKIFHASPAKRLNAECESLRFLKQTGVPVPRLVDSGNDLAGCHWLVETKLQGIAADTAFPSLTPRNGEDLAYRLGKLIGQVHSIRPEDTTNLPQITVSERVYSTLQSKPQLPTDARELINATFDGLTASRSSRTGRPTVLVHRDFSLRNVMIARPVRGTMQIEGVIDFERAFLGDPMEDLATLIRRDFWHNPVLINAALQGYCSSGPGKGYFDGDLLRELVLIQILEIMTWSAADDPDFYQQTKLIAEEILFANGWSVRMWASGLRALSALG